MGATTGSTAAGERKGWGLDPGSLVGAPLNFLAEIFNPKNQPARNELMNKIFVRPFFTGSGRTATPDPPFFPPTKQPNVPSGLSSDEPLADPSNVPVNQGAPKFLDRGGTDEPGLGLGKQDSHFGTTPSVGDAIKANGKKKKPLNAVQELQAWMLKNQADTAAARKEALDERAAKLEEKRLAQKMGTAEALFGIKEDDSIGANIMNVLQSPVAQLAGNAAQIGFSRNPQQLAAGIANMNKQGAERRLFGQQEQEQLEKEDFYREMLELKDMNLDKIRGKDSMSALLAAFQADRATEAAEVTARHREVLEEQGARRLAIQEGRAATYQQSVGNAITKVEKGLATDANDINALARALEGARLSRANPDQIAMLEEALRKATALYSKSLGGEDPVFNKQPIPGQKIRELNPVPS